MAYLTLWERKLIGWMQVRKGPNRVRLFGFLPGFGQPFADVIKLLIKEVVVPAKSNKVLFRLAPAITLIPAFAIWAVIPLAPDLVDRQRRRRAAVRAVAHLGGRVRRDPGRLGFEFEVRLPRRHAFGGADRRLRNRDGFRAGGRAHGRGQPESRRHRRGQQGGWFAWNWFWLFPLFVVYFISGVAETNRAPFDVAEGESEIVAGFHVEYSGIAFALFFLAEYANMILISALTAVFFFGGWLSPFDG